METKFTISGARELDDMLRSLPVAPAGRAGRAAVLAGGRIVAAAAKAKVPVDTGDLKRAIRATGMKAAPGVQEVVARAGVRGKEGPLAHLVELGTEAHPIEANKKTILKTKDGKFLGKVVDHPGAAPHPFLRPAADEKAGEALDKMGTILGERIEAEAKKILAKRSAAAAGQDPRSWKSSGS